MRTYLRSVFSKAGWKWGKDGENLPIYNIDFHVSQFSDDSKDALYKCSNKTSLKISDIIDQLPDPSKTLAKKSLTKNFQIEWSKL